MALHLTLACGDYDRTRALADGTVAPEGVTLNYVTLRPGELFQRVARHREFPAAEMSLATYLNLRARGDDGLVAIPVYPSRLFRHGYIFINVAAGISGPADLRGKRVGAEQYQLTSALWQRGLLQDEYGVSPASMIWYLGGQDEPGHKERATISFPPGLAVHHLAPQATLSQMLAAGEIDAIFAPHVPRCVREGAPTVARLFPDFPAVEAGYYRRTGLFPIMHLVVIRRDVYEAHRWIAVSLFKAFCEAKRVALERLRFTGTLAAMVPWLVAALEEAEALFGEPYWPYGLEANRKELETAIRYAHEQGVAIRRLDVDELFAPETLAAECRAWQ